MKYLLFLVLLSFFITGCNQNNIATEKQCLKKGLILSSETVLNYRTGKYEERYICIKK